MPAGLVMLPRDGVQVAKNTMALAHVVEMPRTLTNLQIFLRNAAGIGFVARPPQVIGMEDAREAVQITASYVFDTMPQRLSPAESCVCRL